MTPCVVLTAKSRKGLQPFRLFEVKTTLVPVVESHDAEDPVKALVKKLTGAKKDKKKHQEKKKKKKK